MPHYSADKICHWTKYEKKNKQTKQKQKFHSENQICKFEHNE